MLKIDRSAPPETMNDVVSVVLSDAVTVVTYVEPSLISIAVDVPPPLDVMVGGMLSDWVATNVLSASSTPAELLLTELLEIELSLPGTTRRYAFPLLDRPPRVVVS